MSSPEYSPGGADDGTDEHGGGLVLPDGFVPGIRSRLGDETADALLDQLQSNRRPARVGEDPILAVAETIVRAVPGTRFWRDEKGAIIIDFGDSEDEIR